MTKRISNFKINYKTPGHNFILLQWRVRLDTSLVILSSEAYRKKAGLLDVTDVAAQCSLITIAVAAGRQAMLNRYAQ